MILTIIVLGSICLAQLALNWALLNRVLSQAGIKPIQLPSMPKTEEPTEVKETRRKIGTFSIQG